MSRLFAGRGVLSEGAWTRVLPRGGRVCLASEPRAWSLFGRQAESALRRRGLAVDRHFLPRGEAAKSWDAVRRLLRSMSRTGLDRGSAVVALGGGAVTDAAGFAAAVFMRGVPWVSAPTTLLGQLDGGLGGKTGVNLPEGKNLAGAFHQPLAVVCDTSCLRGLSFRDRVSGLAEALKIGLCFDPGLWRLMTRGWTELIQGKTSLTVRVIRRAAAWKLRVVSRDERETRGIRELLNFGHTLGHALEARAGYGAWRHGEAVVWGMRAALRLSVRRAGLPLAQAAEAEDFLAGLPAPSTAGLRPRALLEAARRDKKARQGRPRFVLLSRIGRAVVRGGIPDKEVLAAAASCL